MEQRNPPEFIIEAFADPTTVRDVVRGILHTIFFNRFFPTIRPRTRDVLDLTLPVVDDVELETLIDQRVDELARQLDADRAGTNTATAAAQPPSSQPAAATAAAAAQYQYGRHPPPPQQHGSGGNGSGGRGQISVQFSEKKRRKAGWLAMRGGDEEVCWESWIVKVTVAEPRTESERAKVRKAAEATLLASTMKIVTFVNTHKDHIPPITTTEANPFPYHISVNQKESGWAARMGLY